MLAQSEALVEALEDYADDDNYGAQISELAALIESPIDINNATEQDLSIIPWLTPQQASDIVRYVLLHSPVRSLAELMSVPSIDAETRRRILPFLYVGAEAEGEEEKQKATHQLSTRIDMPLYHREGYLTSADDGGYHAHRVNNNVRNRETSEHVLAGLHAEKDQGERGPWDSYGAYVTLRNLGLVRTAVVGDYRLCFGQGLVANNGFSLGKTIASNRRGVYGSNSLDETNYLRGTAVTLARGRWTAIAWLSHRGHDATLNTDSTVATIVTTGYHRTETEHSKKHNLRSTIVGSNVDWAHTKLDRTLTLGLTGYWLRFSRELVPGSATYRAYYPRGTDFGALGLHYAWSRPWLTLNGETAYSTAYGGWATTANALIVPNANYRITINARHFSKKYYSFLASTLSENSTVGNETGCLMRFEASPRRGLTLSAMADVFYNPWPRYGMTHSSLGQEVTTQGEKSLGKHTLMAQYRLKRKESYDVMNTHHRLRFRHTFEPNERLRLQQTINTHSLAKATGASLTEALRIKLRTNSPRQHPLRGSTTLTLMGTYFHTPSYATRVYIYEPTLSGSFSFPASYGHGLRAATVVRHTFLRRHLTLELKYSHLTYFDRTEQSSDMQLIHSRFKNDIQLQLRWDL